MKITFKIAFILVLSALAVSCSKVEKTVKKQITVTALPERADEIKNLDINAAIEFEYKKQSNNSVYANIKIASLDSLALSLIGPFGIALGELYADPNEFLFYDAFNDRAVKGKPTPENMKLVIRAPLAYRDFIRLIRNETPKNPGEYILQKTDSKRANRALFKSKGDESFELVSFSQEKNAIVKFERVSADGETLLQARYSDFIDFGKARIAKLQEYSFPLTNVKLIIDIDDIDTGVEFKKPFYLDLPPSVKVMKLKD